MLRIRLSVTWWGDFHSANLKLDFRPEILWREANGRRTTRSFKSVAQSCERGFDGCDVTQAANLLPVPYTDGVDVGSTADSRALPNVEVEL